MDLTQLNDFLIFDGALGTMLQKKDLVKLGELPPVLNFTKPDDITDIFKEYIAAGSDVITTNTFEANRFKLEGSGYSVSDVVKQAVKVAEDSGAKYIALDIGPTGKLVEPLGPLSFNEAYEAFKEIVVAAPDSVNVYILETFSDLLEIKAALLAVKENSDKPVICSMTYNEDGRTFSGTDPVTATITLQNLGADAVGVNCSLGPKELIPVVEKIVKVATVPVIVEANAGLPKIVNGKTTYTITPEEYAASVEEIADLGVQIIGGCCGTTPEYIQVVKEALKQKKFIKDHARFVPAVTSSTRTEFLDSGVHVVGERINPTGRENLKEALRTGIYDPIIAEGLKEEREGANILDVNVGLPEIDEVEAIRRIVTELTGVCPLPLQLDSTDPNALEAALRVYPGIPIINSVNGTEKSMSDVLPLAKHYGALVIGLPLDENGIPKTAEGRIKVAKKILTRAEEIGINKERIILDGLCLTASAEQKSVLETLETIRYATAELGLLTTLGVSNISFGLPERELFNSVFLSSCLGAGLKLPIVNPGLPSIMEVIDVFRVMDNEDRESLEYIKKYSNRKRKVISESEESQESGSSEGLTGLIIDGLKDQARVETKRLLKEMTPEEIINSFFVPALNSVGESFETGKIFLPQLLQSASAVKESFNVLKEVDSGEGTKNKGNILLATVKGDIHDIGKNIVKMMLENYGYNVYDLGNDVDPETIIAKAREFKTPLIGLSALMTTTVDSMKETIDKIKEEGLNCHVMVGGAVLTEEYSDLIDADFYGSDAQAAVEIANNFFKEEKK